jgi:hypothetical protein
MPYQPMTLDQAREAFQAQIPHRRDDFCDEIKRLKDEHTRNGTLFSKYIQAVARAAKLEMRERHEAAMRAIEMLINDCWEPTAAETIDGAYESMFREYRSADREPFSDLKRAVESAYADIGNNGPDLRQVFEHDIGGVQSRSYESCAARLRVYRPGKPSGGTIFTAPVGVVQIGDANLGVIETERSAVDRKRS